jgi:uncharacterized protein (DUF4213/DUF364 family)
MKTMSLNDKLFNLFRDKAQKVHVDLLCLGLGYTAVVTSDGGIGIAYTYFEDKKSCMLLNETVDYEGRPASELLEKIKSDATIEKSMALALVNALNYQNALQSPEDENNEIMFEKFKITKGTKVAMVGYFGPLIKRFEQREAVLDILDQSRGLGRMEDFYKKLKNWADVLFLTSTSILNNSTEEILAPMVAEAFDHLPVHMLAGTVPLDRENVIKAVRHGMGTPVLHRFSRKSFLSLA